MSFNCGLDLADAGKDSITAFFRGAASRPGGPPVLWLGGGLWARPAERRRSSCRLTEHISFVSNRLTTSLHIIPAPIILQVRDSQGAASIPWPICCPSMAGPVAAEPTNVQLSSVSAISICAKIDAYGQCLLKNRFSHLR
jgi:hypothetical protein